MIDPAEIRDSVSCDGGGLSTEERLAAQTKRPAVFRSESSEGGRSVVRTAVTWAKIVPDWSLNGRDMIADRWVARKKATGNAPCTSLSWDAAAKGSGMDVASIAATVKAVHKRNPYVVVFDVDRMGNNVGFHIKDEVAFRKAEPDKLPLHWTR